MKRVDFGFPAEGRYNGCNFSIKAWASTAWAVMLPAAFADFASEDFSSWCGVGTAEDPPARCYLVPATESAA